MDGEKKTALLERAKTHLHRVRGLIREQLSEISRNTEGIKYRIDKLPAADKVIQAKVLQTHLRKTQELEALYPSPYFIKCELKFDGEEAPRIFYFAKFSLPDQSIYSWTTPAAAVRFDQPGRFSYGVPGYVPRTGELLGKEQYMINEGKILFMAAESLHESRQLIYQDYFSQQKTLFALPEIVEQMEKAQDKVIRAHYQGSFLISGPAGSGKTTLALHRVAYLLQSPDTADRFNSENTIIFVQDASTKAYFGALLPQLGINDVVITTFDAWARQQLGLQDFLFAARYGDPEALADRYEYFKYQALREARDVPYSADVYTILQRIYVPYFTEDLTKLFLRQKQEQVLDRFDLTLLLRCFINTHGLRKKETIIKQLSGGKIRRTYQHKSLRYSLMVVDEVQNYLPEQIQLLRSSLDKINSIIYVGDLAQQTRLCTLRNWEDAGEQFIIEERKVMLQKNYRSSKQILSYIRQLGYAVELPLGIKEGPEVKEYEVASVAQELEQVVQLVQSHPGVVIGVMAKLVEHLVPYLQVLASYENVHVLTINEAQGVEFEVVCLVGITSKFFEMDYEAIDLRQEKQRVNRDLLYVALTRAMQELHVFGQVKLSELKSCL